MNIRIKQSFRPVSLVVPGLLLIDPALACSWVAPGTVCNGNPFFAQASIASEVGNTYAAYISTTASACSWVTGANYCSGGSVITDSGSALVTSKSTSGSWLDDTYSFGQSEIHNSTACAHGYVTNT